MSWFSHNSEEAQAHAQLTGGQHHAALSHEVIAGAAAYEAAKAYEHHCARHGKPPTHEKAMEILAGLSGAFVDRLVETKGLDYIDRKKAKDQAQAVYTGHVQNQY